MANKMALGLVIGGVVSSTVGAAFRDVENRVKTLSDKGKKARVLQSTIGETMRLRDEWKKAHDAGEKGAAGLLRRLENNLTVLRKEGIEVGHLAREYDRLGRAGRSAELQAKGRHQIDQGKHGLRNGITQATVGAGVVAIPAKISADYQAIIRDIAIKAGVAKTDQEAQMSRRVIQTSQDVGMGRNDVANVVNQLVGAGMELRQALEFAPVAAKFVVGQGSTGVDTAKMIYALQSNAKITDPKQLEKALEAVAFQGQAGSFEASDMARWFPELLAGMQKQGITGMDAVTQLGSMLQVQMKTAGSADEAANNLKNWMEKIGSGDVVKAYQVAGIDYQKSLNDGIQNGMSTLEASFGLAKKYIETTDPKKAREMAEATAKINKETDPAKAKEMLANLEQMLRTGDIFADMQVKSALAAYVQNKALYDQLKKDAGNASGILDKNLAERRDTSSQKWNEALQAGNDALRSVGDAIRPATDALASGLTSAAKGITSISDASPMLVMGLTGLGASAVAAMTVLKTIKIGQGVFNVGRGRRGARDGGAPGVHSPEGQGEGAHAGSSVDPVDTGRKVRDALGGGTPGEAAGNAHIQKVFVVNAGDLGGPGGAGGSRRARRRARLRASPPSSPPTPSSPSPSSGLGLRDVVGKVGKLGKALPGEAVFEAGIKAFETFNTAKTDDEKGEGYGAAAGGLAGTMAGAAAGAAIGSVVPILGTAVGGMVGAMLGAMGGESLGSMLGKSTFAKTLFGSESAPGDVVRSMTAQAGPPPPPSPLLLKPEIKPAAIEQKITFAPHMPITIEGDVKDPAELTRQLDTLLQSRFRDFSRELEDSARRANDRQLYDSPHVG
ncbi:phage tail tape-measure protein [Pseudomonas lini]|uniref:phage tail tape measure protein n=1 Tax=Pseudomonas lini TaxID=163011 RepID=UPI00277EB112|nr:phage tail tape measure protein [Pseudomonas lini]MDQ0124257.1 phage tail tape-measure protein [Pseudomonas lini]